MKVQVNGREKAGMRCFDNKYAVILYPYHFFLHFESTQIDPTYTQANARIHINIDIEISCTGVLNRTLTIPGNE